MSAQASRFGFSPDELRELQQAFFDEAAEHVTGIDAAALALEARPDDGEALAALLRQLHTLKGAAGTVELDDIAAAAHALEDRLVALRGAGRPPTGEDVAPIHRDLAALRRSLGKSPTPAVQPAEPAPAPEPAPAASETPPERRATDRRATDRRAGEPAVLRVEVERMDELIDAAGELLIDRTRVARRLQELAGCVRDVALVRRSLRAVLTDPTLRTSGDPPELSRRLGEVDAELAAAAASLERAAAGLGDDTEALNRTAQGLQEGLQRARMLRVGRLFQRLAPQVADLARRAGKSIDLVTEGEDTEIDKAVVERVADPLLHLLRNAVAHGVESPEARRAAGKPAAGRVVLAAAQRGQQVVLTVADDGAGIDRERVRAVLARAGRQDAAALSDEALLDAIFEHGLSTRDGADALAGRGVGLDAVKEAALRLGGSVACDSAPGLGTRFIVRLPLTTAIAQALLFKVGGNVYAVPASAVVETVQVARTDVTPLRSPLSPTISPSSSISISSSLSPSSLLPSSISSLSSPSMERSADTAPSGERVTIRGQTLPLVRLGALLGVPAPPGPTTRRWGLVLEHEGARFAITCDKVIGPREIVVKRLGPLLAPLSLYAGATISGAGKVQLILDVDALAREARRGRSLGERPAAPDRRRVLVADDSRTLREACALLLTQGGYRVDTAPDGWDAWELLQDQPFDLLITDLEMPRLDGCELTARVRRHPHLRHLSVLLMSSRSGEAARHRALVSGADGFLPKPVRRRPLLDAVQAALARHSGGDLPVPPRRAEPDEPPPTARFPRGSDYSPR